MSARGHTAPTRPTFHGRKKTITRRWFSGATGLGNAVAGIVGGGTADLIGVSPTFFVLAATPLLGALLMVRGVAASEAIADVPVERAARAPWRAVLRLPVAVWVGVLVMFFITGLNALFVPGGPFAGAC